MSTWAYLTLILYVSPSVVTVAKQLETLPRQRHAHKPGIVIQNLNFCQRTCTVLCIYYLECSEN